MAYINTRKPNWYVSSITDVFLDQSKFIGTRSTNGATGICDCQNLSVKLIRINVCFSSEYLFIFQ